MKKPNAPTAAPFVATNLSVYREEVAPNNPGHPSDIAIDGIPYRRLDPAYYAWLRSRMEKAKQAWQSGKLNAPSFAALRDKFNAIHDEAIRLFGETALLRAVSALDPKTYPAPARCSEEEAPRIPEKEQKERPEEREKHESHEAAVAQPSPLPKRLPPDMNPAYLFPQAEDPELPCRQTIRTSALEKVRAIEADALAAGWTMNELYRNRGRFRFPYGEDYGIVCFIDPDQKLGKVATDSIELITRNGRSLYFRRDHRERVATTKPIEQTQEKASA